MRATEWAETTRRAFLERSAFGAAVLSVLGRDAKAFTETLASASASGRETASSISIRSSMVSVAAPSQSSMVGSHRSQASAAACHSRIAGNANMVSM